MNNLEMDRKICDLEQELLNIQSQLTELHQQKKPEEVENYEFSGPEGLIKLADLFGEKSELILIHNMGKKCSYCTLWADGFNGFTDHLKDRAAFALTSTDDFKTLSAFAESRGWRFPYYSVGNEKFIKDMGFWGKYGDDFDHGEGPWPGVSTFIKKDNKIFRQTFAKLGPGDLFCSLWHLFDLLPNGSNNWQPKFKY